MANADAPQHAGFTDDRAKTYDERVRRHIPGYETLHGLAETLLAGELPAQASVLAVGTGTGAEILGWAPKHPGWRFLGTDTAPAMLALANEKAAAAGLSDRARWHSGLVESLPRETFDAATLLLVLHFVPDRDKPGMLRAIADRLKPGAPFLLANLFGDPQSSQYQRLNAGRKAWATARGLEPSMAEQFCDPTRPDMHIVPEENLMTLLRNAGFVEIERIYQALTVGLWIGRTAR